MNVHTTGKNKGGIRFFFVPHYNRSTPQTIFTLFKPQSPTCNTRHPTRPSNYSPRGDGSPVPSPDYINHTVSPPPLTKRGRAQTQADLSFNTSRARFAASSTASGLPSAATIAACAACSTACLARPSAANHAGVLSRSRPSSAALRTERAWYASSPTQ